MIKIYTDGSTRKNGEAGAPGAYGFIAIGENGEILQKYASGFTNATNQKAELKAIISACEWADKQFDSFTDVQIISDSAYAINCYAQKWHVKWLSNGWRTSNNGEVKNIELWQQLIPYFERANYSFVKVKGHAGDKYNCMIDEMVQSITGGMI